MRVYIFSLLFFVGFLGVWMTAVLGAELLLAPTGEASAYFGRSVALGDINGDGIDDLVVGAPRSHPTMDTGTVEIFYGGAVGNFDDIPDVVITGSYGEFFGLSVNCGGNLDGSGGDDILVGAPYGDSAGTIAGRVYVFYSDNLTAEMTTAQADVVITGENALDDFGFSICNLGDVDGAGLDDIVVGAYRSDVGGNYSGCVYVFYAESLSDSLGAANADIIIAGNGSSSFGVSVAKAGNVDGVGGDDLVVGANLGGVGAPGQAYVFFANNFSPTMSATGADVIITGEQNSDEFGHAVAGSGDIDGDGRDDIVIGAPDAAGNFGRSYVFYASGLSNNIDAANADVIISGTTIYCQLGRSLAIVGNLDGAGGDDLLIGEPYVSNNSVEGNAYVFLADNLLPQMTTENADAVVTGEVGHGCLGWSVTGDGDVNGDGRADIVVGAAGYSDNYPTIQGAGRVYVYDMELYPEADGIIEVPSEIPTIAEAFTLAGPGDTVEVASGTYYEHDLLMPSGVTLRGATGDPDDVTIDAQQLGRVVYCDSLAVAVRFEAITFTGGDAGVSSQVTGKGGGLLIYQTETNMVNCVLTGNSAERGGGLSARYDYQLTMTGCRIEQNTVTIQGGGIEIREMPLVVSDCIFSANETSGSGSWGEQGGAAWFADIDGVFSNCTFENNTSTRSGGAICMRRSNPTISDCVFSGNEASDLGGVVYVLVGSGETAAPTFIDCLFNDNVAMSHGGVAYFQDQSGILALQPTFTGCTLVGNTGLVGVGGIANNQAALTVSNTIIANSVSGMSIRCWGGSIDVSCSNMHNNPGGNYVDCLSGLLGVNGNISANPRFCDAAGGDYSLDNVSPCVPNNNSCGEWMGSEGVGCMTSPVLYVPEVFPSILAAMQLATEGNTIVVAAGIYYEHDLPMPSGVVLRGATGHPSGVTIDAQQQGRVVLCEALAGSVRFEALTLTGGLVAGGYPDGYGGAIAAYSTDVVVSNCLITGNQATYGAGAIFWGGSEATVEDCVLSGNDATDLGGGLAFFETPTSLVDGCTLFGNSAASGGSAILNGTYELIVRNTLITDASAGTPITLDSGGTLDLACSNIYSNTAGNYIDGASGWLGTAGNISADPLYCESGAGNYSLTEGSVCLPENNTCSVQIGAWGMGCQAGGAVIDVPADYGTIAEALANANPGDTVLLAAGTYNEHNLEMASGVYLRGGTGNPAQVIIDAQGNYHALICDSLQYSVRLEGLTFTGGVADGASYPDNSGGAILIDFTEIAINNCVFSENSANVAGAVYAKNGKILTIENSIFLENSSVSSSGVMRLELVPLVISDCQFLDNDCSEGSVGTIRSSSSVWATRCVFSNNSSFGHAGAMLFHGDDNTVSLVDCEFTGNSCKSHGGAIFINGNNRTDVITGCSFEDNYTTQYYGGAIYYAATGSETYIGYCVFNNNNATFSTSGDAIDFRECGPVTVSNCTFVNHQDYPFSVGSTQTLNMDHCIVAFGTGSIRYATGATINLICNDFWGNQYDYSGIFSGALGNDGNISEPPRFCGGGGGSELMTLLDSSPCQPDNNPYDSQLIGALGVGCEGSVVLRVPEDHATIVSALAWAAEGDSVIVGAGTFNEDTMNVRHRVRLVGTQSGESKDGTRAPLTIITGGSMNVKHDVYDYDGVRISNIVFQGNNRLNVVNACPRVTNCVFTGLRDSYGGHKVSVTGGQPRFNGCTFSNNQIGSYPSGGHGAAIQADQYEYNIWTKVWLFDCLFYDNSAGSNPSIEAIRAYLVRCTFFRESGRNTSATVYSNELTIQNCIIANTEGYAIGGGLVSMSCCDFWDNVGGDYVGIAAGLEGTSGNISSDPLFIDAANNNFDLYVGSPCGETVNEGCGQIGVGLEDPTIIYDDGSGDYATIGAAVSAVPDSSYIYLANGTFTGAGNWDIVLGGVDTEGLHIVALGSDPDSCIIDLQASSADPHRAFTITAGADSTTVLSGFTITGGYVDSAKGAGDGGAILIEGGASPTIEDLIIDGCAASGGGGGIHCVANSSAAISDLIITDNAASGGGGGIHCEVSSSPTITNVVLIGNSSAVGAGAIHCEAGSEPTIIGCTMVENASVLGSLYFGDESIAMLSSNIVAYTVDGPAVACEPTAVLDITCTDVFANDGGDWSGCIDELDLVGDNFSSDPLFCSLAERDLYLMSNSPCAENFSPGGCGQIGALPVGCEATAFTVGASGDYITLDDALNNAPNGSVIVLDGGVYTGPGFSGLEVEGSSFTIAAAAEADSCVIVCDGSVGSPQRAFSFLAGAKSDDGRAQGSAPMILRGLTLRGGYGTQGGAIRSDGVDLHLEDCLIYNNEAVEGGAIFLKDCQAIITGTTIGSNAAATGGGIYCDNAWPELTSSIIYGSTQGEAIFALEQGMPPVCTDIFGNQGGDWTGVLLGLQDIFDNLSADPLFCNVELGYYNLTESSPCHPDSNACQVLIGALPVGCSSTSPVFDKDIPHVCVLEDNYPNPFNPLTTIRFGLPDNRHVKLSLYDVRGRRIAVLLDEVMDVGWHDVQWAGRDGSGRRVSSGVYFYRFEAGEAQITRRMALIK